ncbi:MAG: tetratricopeptide repeat protein [Planctomycetota bacterium]
MTKDTAATPSKQRFAVLGLGCWLLLAGLHCDRTPVAAPPAAIAFPQLHGLDPAVRTHLEEVQKQLQRATSDAKVLGEAGLTYLAYKFNGAAASCFERAAEIAPDDRRWHYYRGHVLANDGATAAALAAFRKALELQPTDVPTLIHLARLELEQHDLENAARHFQAALVEAPETSAADVGLGRIALQRGDYDAARAHLEAALRRTPKATEACYSLGLAYRGLGKPQLAAQWMQRQGEARAGFPDPLLDAVEARIRGHRLHHDLGLRYFGAGEFETAVGYFRQAIESGAEDARTHMNLASALARWGDQTHDPASAAKRHQEAETHYLRALEIDPEGAVANYTYGTFLARKKLTANAVLHYQRALQRDTDNPDCHFNLANALRRLGRFRDARGHYEEVIRLQPLNATARFALALTHLRLGDVTAAHRLLAKSHAALPQDTRIATGLARILAAAPESHAGLRDGARAETLARWLRSRENSVTHIETHAMALADLGQFEAAASLIRSAMDAVEKQRRTELLPGLLAMLRSYEQRSPWRTPWRIDDPLLSP